MRTQRIKQLHREVTRRGPGGKIETVPVENFASEETIAEAFATYGEGHDGPLAIFPRQFDTAEEWQEYVNREG